MNKTLWSAQVERFGSDAQIDTIYTGWDREKALKAVEYDKNHTTEREAANRQWWLLGWKTDRDGDPEEIMDALEEEDGRYDPDKAERI